MRIFEVEFYFTERIGNESRSEIKATERVTAKNCSDAIEKVRKHFFDKVESFKDEDTGKIIEIRYTNYDPINVILLAESQY